MQLRLLHAASHSRHADRLCCLVRRAPLPTRPSRYGGKNWWEYLNLVRTEAETNAFGAIMRRLDRAVADLQLGVQIDHIAEQQQWREDQQADNAALSILMQSVIRDQASLHQDVRSLQQMLQTMVGLGVPALGHAGAGPSAHAAVDVEAPPGHRVHAHTPTRPAHAPSHARAHPLQLPPPPPPAHPHPQHGLLRLFVKTLSGKTFAVAVELPGSADRVKAQVQAQEGIPPAHQRLIFAGKLLEDGRALADYALADSSTVRLVLRLPDGAQVAAGPLLCPLTGLLYAEPVVDPEGNSYSRGAIEAWLSYQPQSPYTLNPLHPGDLRPNTGLAQRAAQVAARLAGRGRGPPEDASPSRANAATSDDGGSTAGPADPAPDWVVVAPGAEEPTHSPRAAGPAGSRSGGGGSGTMALMDLAPPRPAPANTPAEPRAADTAALRAVPKPPPPSGLRQAGAPGTAASPGAPATATLYQCPDCSSRFKQWAECRQHLARSGHYGCSAFQIRAGAEHVCATAIPSRRGGAGAGHQVEAQARAPAGGGAPTTAESPGGKGEGASDGAQAASGDTPRRPANVAAGGRSVRPCSAHAFTA